MSFSYFSYFSWTQVLPHSQNVSFLMVLTTFFYLSLSLLEDRTLEASFSVRYPKPWRLAPGSTISWNLQGGTLQKISTHNSSFIIPPLLPSRVYEMLRLVLMSRALPQSDTARNENKFRVQTIQWKSVVYSNGRNSNLR